IISSPEAFHDSNKLRPALFSKELAGRRHVIVIDEAHCVKTWGETGFRTVYERIGDMRVFMPDPEHSPVCAATATCSEPVRNAITRCLHMRKDYQYINLGNWRPNLRYGLHILEGGQRSYHELTQFFDPDAQAFAEVPQAVIFVETYLAGYYIAYELRQHFGLNGNAALEGIAVYHSLLGDLTKRYIESLFRSGKLRILISTEALTMGANFPNIRLVLTFLATQTLEAWVQRAGRGARSPHILCLCIMIVTKSIVQAAVKACKHANVPVDPMLAMLKVEELEGEEEDVPEGPQDIHASPEDAPSPLRPLKSHKGGRRAMNLGVSEYIATMDCRTSSVSLKSHKGGRRAMNLGVSEYIATMDCRTSVIDREFNNPPHTSCYEIGGCDRCVERRQKDEEADQHLGERLLLKAEAEDRNIEDFEPGETQERKKPGKRDNERYYYGELKSQFVDALTAWRWDKFMELSDEEADQHLGERLLLKAEAEDRNIEDFEPRETQEHKKPGKRDNEHYYYGELKSQFVDALTAWRWDKFMELSELYSITPDHIMADCSRPNVEFSPPIDRVIILS
ncbi:hypothetical protein RSAG8_13832, partial [Rhizoctonia solani AG-8 WAC10335]